MSPTRREDRCISARADWTPRRCIGGPRSPVHLCVCGVDRGETVQRLQRFGASLRVRSGLLLTCGCVVALPLRDVGAGWATGAVCPAFRADDACHGGDSLKRALVGRSWRVPGYGGVGETAFGSGGCWEGERGRGGCRREPDRGAVVVPVGQVLRPARVIYPVLFHMLDTAAVAGSCGTGC